MAPPAVVPSSHHLNDDRKQSSPPKKTCIDNLKLVFCISGIYIFFLTWGVMQERLAGTLYYSEDGSGYAKFRHFVFLNCGQAIVSALIAFLLYFFSNRDRDGKGDHKLTIPRGHLLLDYVKIAVTGCLASPFGYAALKHINYPTMILGKSCKLLPLVLLNAVGFNRRAIEPYKYVTVLMITVGVSGFMFFSGDDSGKKALDKQSSVYGLTLLICNLLLDGITNTWQDEMFLRHRVRSQHMMFFMNAFVGMFLFAYLVGTGLLLDAYRFINTHNRNMLLTRDMLLFWVCGGMGQVFIFATIEHFGSLILVTVTVTRKLFTILLSLLYFNHKLAPLQWLSVSIVFAALGFEAFYKQLTQRGHLLLKKTE